MIATALAFIIIDSPGYFLCYTLYQSCMHDGTLTQSSIKLQLGTTES